MSTTIYIVQRAEYVCAFSTLEKAQAWCDAERNANRNRPYEWRRMVTDMRGVEQWVAPNVLFNGGIEEIAITSYPVDKTPEELFLSQE